MLAGGSKVFQFPNVFRVRTPDGNIIKNGLYFVRILNKA